jgi:kynurenine 3-monooxygenase
LSFERNNNREVTFNISVGHKIKMHILINGGGLAGALAAVFFLQHTKQVTVVEKRSDIRKATVEAGRSINLILTSRGLFALRQVNLEAAALKLCVPVEGRSIHTQAGQEQFQPYGVSPNEVNYSVPRTKLNAMLIEEAERRGARFFFEHELTGIDFSNNCASYKCPSGTLSMRADVIFGSDGVGSPVRQLMIKQLTAEGVKATETMERLGISYKELTFPHVISEGNKREYAMNQRGLHIWPRGAHFLMALADKNETFTGTLYLPDGSATLAVPSDGVPTFDELQGDPAKYEALIAKYYPDVPKLVPDYKQQLSSRGHGFLATLRTSHWHYKGQVCLFGDAAHGVVPFFGQGMNLAFESVVVLNRFISQHGLSKEGLETAFQRFYDHHYSSAVSIANMAIENFTEMSFKVSQAEFLKRKQIENAVESKFPKLLRSRYYMVTKTLIPYRLVQAAGPRVEACIDDLQVLCAAKNTTIDQLPDAAVTAVIDKHLTPFFKEHRIVVGDTSVEYYPPSTRSKV